MAISPYNTNHLILKKPDPCQKCSGCAFEWDQITQVFTKKTNQLVNQLSEFYNLDNSLKSYFSSSPLGFRNRWDFQIRGQQFGLIDSLDHLTLHPLTQCPLLTEELNTWYKQFISYPFNIKKGSVRLRVGPNKQNAVWLDFSHEDIKNLFEEKLLLTELLKTSYVEVGQKRKTLKKLDSGELTLLKHNPKLPQLFRTYITKDLIPFDLSLHVADFTQPSWEMNKAILSSISQLELPHPIAEFGSGIGNFTFMLASLNKNVFAFELDPYSEKAFIQNKSNFDLLFSQYKDHIQYIRQDAQTHFQSRSHSDSQSHSHSHSHSNSLSKSKSQNYSDLDTIKTLFLNPSRSGVGQFFLNFNMQMVEKIIYLSCYPQSLIKDLGILNKDFQVTQINFFDQFPHTPHLETLVELTKK